jgi:hypothetical protein
MIGSVVTSMVTILVVGATNTTAAPTGLREIMKDASHEH